MPIEHKPHRASSSALAHLDGLLDEALEQTFPASDAVAIDFERKSHDREARLSIPALRPLATGWASGPHRDTDAYPTSARTHRGDAKQTNCCADGMLQHLAPTSRLFKVMKHPSENQSQEVLAGLVERVTYHNVMAPAENLPACPAWGWGRALRGVTASWRATLKH